MFWWQKIHMMLIHSKTTMHVLSWEFVHVIQTFVSPINLILMKTLLDYLHGVMIKLLSEASVFLAMNTIHSQLTKYIGILKIFRRKNKIHFQIHFHLPHKSMHIHNYSCPAISFARRKCWHRWSRSWRHHPTSRSTHCRSTCPAILTTNIFDEICDNLSS